MTTVITTFSEQGYNVYGKRWIESVIQNWPEDIRVVVYIDFDLAEPADNFLIKQFDAEFPYHPEFKKKIYSHYEWKWSDTIKYPVIKEKTVKFSYKSFVIIDQLEKSTDNYLIWLDGDVETLSKIVPEDFDFLGDNFLACQKEILNRGKCHIESGFLLFNLNHPIRKQFTEEFKKLYYDLELLNFKKPYDGFLLAHVIENLKVTIFDFNYGNISGLQSSKDSTFQHPFLKERFIHRIGVDKKL
jgi:hypothetical protein